MYERTNTVFLAHTDKKLLSNRALLLRCESSLQSQLLHSTATLPYAALLSTPLPWRFVQHYKGIGRERLTGESILYDDHPPPYLKLSEDSLWRARNKKMLLFAQTESLLHTKQVLKMPPKVFFIKLPEMNYQDFETPALSWRWAMTDPSVVFMGLRVVFVKLCGVWKWKTICFFLYKMYKYYCCNFLQALVIIIYVR